MPSFIIVGYVQQILGRAGGGFFASPIREQSQKSPSWIGLMESFIFYEVPCKATAPLVFIKQKHWVFLERYMTHCVKSVRIRSFSGLYFPAFGLNTNASLISQFLISGFTKSQALKINTNGKFVEIYIWPVGGKFIRVICCLLKSFANKNLQKIV